MLVIALVQHNIPSMRSILLLVIGLHGSAGLYYVRLARNAQIPINDAPITNEPLITATFPFVSCFRTWFLALLQKGNEKNGTVRKRRLFESNFSGVFFPPFQSLIVKPFFVAGERTFQRMWAARDYVRLPRWKAISEEINWLSQIIIKKRCSQSAKTEKTYGFGLCRYGMTSLAKVK